MRTEVPLICAEEVYQVVGAAVEVHRELGPGFLEAVYQEAIQLELQARSIPYEAQKPLSILFKGHVLQKQYVADLICFDKVLVELKALPELTGRETAQV